MACRAKEEFLSPKKEKVRMKTICLLAFMLLVHGCAIGDPSPVAGHDSGVPWTDAGVASLGENCGTESTPNLVLGTWTETGIPRSCEVGTVCAAFPCSAPGNPTECTVNPDGGISVVTFEYRCLAPCDSSAPTCGVDSVCLRTVLSYVAVSPSAPSITYVCVLLPVI